MNANVCDTIIDKKNKDFSRTGPQGQGKDQGLNVQRQGVLEDWDQDKD